MTPENAGKLQSEIAYKKINDLILHMELLPGQHISEVALSKRLSISRTPIRDGLRRLEKEGLVRISKNRGASVTDFTQDEIKNVGHVRLVQDILSVQMAIYYGCEADFSWLEQLADVCAKQASRDDAFGRIRSDLDFHLAITEIADNDLLYRQQYSVYQLVHLIQVRKYSSVDASMSQISHHKPLVAAMRRGDVDEAVRLVCEHLKLFFSLDDHILEYYLSHRVTPPGGQPSPYISRK